MKIEDLDPDLVGRAEQVIRDQGLLPAVILVRRETGAGLSPALEVVRAIARPIYAVEVEDQDMGMSAEVLAIGPFAKSLVEHLEYPAAFYEQTREGAVIITLVFETLGGSTPSRALANAFGVDPWDFNSHLLDPAKVDLDALRDLFPGEPSLDAFLALRSAGFSFYFRPNG